MSDRKPKTIGDAFAKHSKVGKSNVARSKSHERRIAHLLTDWSGVEFRRRRVEGRDTATMALESTSDVIPVAGDVIITIEAKCGSKFSLDALMATPLTCLFTEWWHQTCYDAKLLTDIRQRPIYPTLFFKPQPAFDWFALSARLLPVLTVKPTKSITDLRWLVYDAYEIIGEVEGDVSHSKKHPKLVKLKLDPVVFCRWRDFADVIDPKSIFYEREGHGMRLRQEEQDQTGKVDQ